MTLTGLPFCGVSLFQSLQKSDLGTQLVNGTHSVTTSVLFSPVSLAMIVELRQNSLNCRCFPFQKLCIIQKSRFACGSKYHYFDPKNPSVYLNGKRYKKINTGSINSSTNIIIALRVC